MKELPPRLIFADVETTGFHSSDRIVSLGVVDLDTRALREGRITATTNHLIFDPGKKSHPKAELVHGYDDWTLRHQDPFKTHAHRVRPFFDDTSIVWAHNAAFDQEFLRKEFADAGVPISGELQCTMQLFRSRRPGSKAGLAAITESMGLRRSSDKHGALEDAWLAMAVYLALNGFDAPHPAEAALEPPANLRAPPPLYGPLPRRSKRRTAVPDAAVVELSASKAVANASRSIATMMLFVAMADGEIAEQEWATLLRLVSETCERLDLKLKTTEMHDVVATLLDPDTAFSVRGAAAEIVRDDYAKQNIARWIREVTYADGVGSSHENAAIVTLTAALREARENLQ